MTGRIEKTVFISYRRTNLPWALAIFQNLKNEGYDVFFDYLSIDDNDLEHVIIENIKARAHFIVLLTPSALDGLNDPKDWLRREIEEAIDQKRNIVPLLLDGFDFGDPMVNQAFTGKLALLSAYNGLRVPAEYFDEAMKRLRQRFLNVALSDLVIQAIPPYFITTPYISKLQEPKEKPLSIFLCHANQDKPVVRDMYTKLVTDGFDTWLNADKLLPGQDWDYDIESTIENS